MHETVYAQNSESYWAAAQSGYGGYGVLEKLSLTEKVNAVNS